MNRQRRYYDMVVAFILLALISTVIKYPTVKDALLKGGCLIIYKDEQAKNNDVTDAAATTSTTPYNNKHGTKYTVSLVTSFWAVPPSAAVVEEGPPHRAEIEASLLNNINNPNFDQVVVILDSTTPESNCTHFYQRMNDLQEQFQQWSTGGKSVEQIKPQLTCMNRPKGQPNYFEMFRYATNPSLVRGDVVVLANADQAFDDTVYWASHIKNTTVLTLATWGYNSSLAPQDVSRHLIFALEGKSSRTKTTPTHAETTNSKCHKKNSVSFDAIVFHRKLIQGRLEKEDFKRDMVQNPVYKEKGPTKRQKVMRRAFFKMNENGAENAGLHAMLLHVPEAKDYKGCSVIRTWHFHLFAKMHNSHTKKTGYWKDISGRDHVPKPGRVPDNDNPHQGAFEVPPEVFAINK